MQVYHLAKAARILHNRSGYTCREDVADGDLPSQVKAIGLPIYHTGVEAGILKHGSIVVVRKLHVQVYGLEHYYCVNGVESCWPRGRLWLARFTSVASRGTACEIVCFSTQHAMPPMPDPQSFQTRQIPAAIPEPYLQLACKFWLICCGLSSYRRSFQAAGVFCMLGTLSS